LVIAESPLPLNVPKHQSILPPVIFPLSLCNWRCPPASDTATVNDQSISLGEQEQKAVLTICILAAFADGSLNELERNEIKRIAGNFSAGGEDIYQQAFAGTASLPNAIADLQSPPAKTAAYEMAVCICRVDSALSSAEERFLGQLRDGLKLDPLASAEFQQNAARIPDAPPVIATVPATVPNGLDEMIRDRAILAGALELLPNRLATMAIVPVQMRMVYQIGKNFGFDLDLAHTKEFFATVGVGLTSQVVEGYLSRMVSHLARPLVGKFIAGLASQATESAVAFATTYALGQVAKSYYSSGRTLSTAQLRDTFSRMLNDGRSMQSRYSSQIAQRAGSLKISDFVPA
jgi:uncharacterized protein (DUF697 family)